MSRSHLLFAWLLAAALAFVSALSYAMYSYPGGNVFNPARPGFDFWLNNFCDLFRETGHNGLPNPARGAAMAGLAALVLGALPVWFTAPRRLGASKFAARLIAFLGLFASVAAAGVTMRVNDPAVHGPAIFLAGVPFNLAVWGLSLLSVRSEGTPLWLKAAGVLLMASMLMSFGSYFAQVALGQAPSLLLPVTQKSSALFLVVWLYGLARLRETSATGAEDGERRRA